MPALFKNNASATIANSLTTTDVTLILSAGLGNSFPSPSGSNYFYGTLFDSVGNYEIVKCTARTTDTLTIVRGQDGTNPLEFTAGDGFALRPIAAVLNNFVQLDGAQEITGVKTFSSGLVGNVTGDVTGDVTGNLTGNVTGNLTGNVTGNLTGNADTATNATTANSIVNSGDWTINFGSATAGVVTASISSTTMTVTAVDSGSISAGQILSGTGVTVGTKLVSQTNALGATAATTHTFVSEGTSGQNRIVLDSLASVKVGQFITGTGVPAGTTVSSMSYGYPLYIELSNNLTDQAAGDYSFYNPHGVGTYVISPSQSASSTTVTASIKKVNFTYNGTTVATLDSGGNFVTTGNFQSSGSI